jgi:hypothetical protein
MNTKALRDEIERLNAQALTADGFDDALIGYVDRFGQETIALYDMEKCIDILMKRDKMGRSEAEEFFSFNVIGAWMGDGTPAFATIRRAVR